MTKAFVHGLMVMLPLGLLPGALHAQTAPAAPAQAAPSGPVKLDYYSWSIFKMTSPGGKIILTNPFVNNPDSPVKVPDFPKVDVILVADGHGDEVGSTDEIALKTGAKIITAFEMGAAWFQPKNVPVEQLIRVEQGDYVTLDGISIRTVNSVHGSGTPDQKYGGPAMGFFVRFENGYTVYFAGSTDITLDMQLWGRMFKPNAAILPLSARRDPAEVVEMVKFLRTDNPNLKYVIPHHQRLKPGPNDATPDQLEAAIKAAGLPVTVIKPELNKTYDLAS